MKLYKFFILSGIGIIALFCVVFIVINTNNMNAPSSNINSSNIDNVTYQNDSITPLEKYINASESLSKVNISFDLIPHNTGLNFQVGDKFEYVVYGVTMSSNWSIERGSHLSQKIECTIPKKERINKKECFVIECSTIAGGFESNYESSESIRSKGITYIDIKTGLPIRHDSITETMSGKEDKIKYYYTAEIPQNIAEVDNEVPFYSPWMLSLNEEFKMEIKKYDKQGNIIIKRDLKVIGKERCGNHEECYKVEEREIDENNKVVSRDVEWIDIKKRILVKAEGYFENLKVVEIVKV